MIPQTALKGRSVMTSLRQQWKRRILILILTTIAVLAPDVRAASRQYTRIETGYNLNDINNHGQATGAGAFIWQNGNATLLGSLFGANQFSEGTAISDFGHVTGISMRSSTGQINGFLVTPEDTDGDSVPDRWYRDSDGNQVNDLMLDLGPVATGAGGTTYDVNGLGQVVGQSFNEAFVWHNGVRTNLGPGWASAINDKGQVVGANPAGAFLINPEDTNGDGNADRWHRDSDNDGQNDLMHPLFFGWAVDINEQGQVLGQTFDRTGLWTPFLPNGISGSFSPVPDEGLTAIGINDLGHAIVWVPGDFANLPMLVESGAFVDLQFTPVLPRFTQLEEYYAINNAGWIVADHGNLLIPVTVPEPAAGVIVLVSAISLMQRRRRF
jgi:hypothetical protein